MNWTKLSGEEKANVITHGLGLVALLAVAPVILIRFYTPESWYIYGSFMFFFAAAIAVYFSSTVYHYCVQPEKKFFWKKLDHICIYLLIGGTYQPFVALYYTGHKGLIFMIVMWSIICLGILLKLFYKRKWSWFSLFMYLALGWMVVFIIKPVMQNISDAALAWCIIGGLSYTIGTIFYKMYKLPYHHAVWHLFVLMGTVSHLICLLVGIQEYGKSIVG